MFLRLCSSAFKFLNQLAMPLRPTISNVFATKVVICFSNLYMYMCDPSSASADFTPSTVIFNTYGREKQVHIPQTRYALAA